ncbi:MAG: hypothetical protein WCP28_20895, partial [Actinomycetes bacterium]
MKHKTKGRLGVAASVVAIAGVTAVISASAGVAAPTAAGGSNDVQTQVRKSVSLTGNADGSVAEAAMVTQVTAVGNGTATINVPIGTNSIRNLNGFASVPAQNNEAVFNLNVSGSTEQRIYTKSDNGPINVTVTATLDGQPIKPGDVVGKTGVLSVNYRVVNTANSMQTVTYKDARGDVVTDTVKVDAPIGGSLDVYLPQGFNEVTAPGASVGGDGMGQTKLSYSMVLFKPLGDPVANLTYQSRITNGTLPGGVFTFLPIVPLDNSTVAATKKAYEGGAQVGTDIYGAGTQIGENLVKLQTGAGQLITGLGTAVAGANELSTKLAGGIPDANKLVKGTRDLSNGISGPLSSGANQLAAGLDKLSNTINTKLAPGAAELSGGAAQLSAALADLQTGVENLPDTVKGEQDYQDAVAGLLGLRGMLTAITTYATDIGAPSPTGGTGNMGTIQTAIATYCAGSTTPDPATCQGLLLAPSANAMIGMVAA